MKIYVAMGDCEIRDSFFTTKALKELQQLGEVELFGGTALSSSKEELIREIKDADVLFTGWGAPAVDQEVLDSAPKLKIHAHVGGSVAANTSKEEYDRGIYVLSGNDLYARSVAEGCLTYTLLALRGAPEVVSQMQETGWREDVIKDKGLIGKKVGIVGYGAIARYYVDLLQWFQVDLYVYSKHISDEELVRIGAKKASKEEIFAECDVISLHSALNDENRGMITKDLFARIKDGALFVNTARAGLMDTEAFLDELEKGRFQAVLDVYDVEPLPMDSRYRKCANVILFPHVAGPTFDMRELVVMALIEDIKRIENGLKPLNEIPYSYAVRMTR